jgi:hypothetical protein
MSPIFSLNLLRFSLCVKLKCIRGDHIIKYRLPKKNQSDGCGSFKYENFKLYFHTEKHKAGESSHFFFQ